MPNHTDIYNMQADTYDLMISKQPDLLAAIEAIRPVRGLDVIDLGAGTGRLSVALAAKAKSILALDASAAMLKLTSEKLARAGLHNWTAKTADHRSIPTGDGTADLVVSGWSLCYVTNSSVADWEPNIDRTLSEIFRVLKRDGTVIIFETLGTGVEQPHRLSYLKDYFRILEQKYGFSCRVLRTDYQFDTVEEAERLIRFFFGDELAGRVLREQWSTVPEYAGMWWLHRS